MLNYKGKYCLDYCLDKASSLFSEKDERSQQLSIAWLLAAYCYGKLQLSAVNRWINNSCDIITEKEPEPLSLDSKLPHLINKNVYKFLQLILDCIMLPHKNNDLPFSLVMLGTWDLLKKWTKVCEKLNKKQHVLAKKYFEFISFKLIFQNASENIWKCFVSIINYHANKEKNFDNIKKHAEEIKKELDLPLWNNYLSQLILNTEKDTKMAHIFFKKNAKKTSKMQNKSDKPCKHINKTPTGIIFF
ncbi:MAG: hypothetical protein PVI75_05420 [Gammaproteobacteria bacterium]